MYTLILYMSTLCIEKYRTVLPAWVICPWLTFVNVCFGIAKRYMYYNVRFTCTKQREFWFVKPRILLEIFTLLLSFTFQNLKFQRFFLSRKPTWILCQTSLRQRRKLTEFWNGPDQDLKFERGEKEYFLCDATRAAIWKEGL